MYAVCGNPDFLRVSVRTSIGNALIANEMALGVATSGQSLAIKITPATLHFIHPAFPASMKRLPSLFMVTQAIKHLRTSCKLIYSMNG